MMIRECSFKVEDVIPRTRISLAYRKICCSMNCVERLIAAGVSPRKDRRYTGLSFVSLYIAS
jgi:hypothetical protein